MNTDQFIQLLSADTKASPRIERYLPVLLVVTAALSGAFFLFEMGIRPNLMGALSHTNILIKNIFPWFLAAGSVGLVMRMARPGAPVGRWPIWIGGVLGVLVLAFLVTMSRTPSADWATAVRGSSRFMCTTSIPLISIPVLTMSLLVLRNCAPVSPTLCGAAAGLMAGSASAGMYAFFCTDDSPMYFAVWYSVAILIVTVAGALIGSRVLRW